MKKTLYCLSRLTEEEENRLAFHYFTITPEINICRSFIAVLHSNGVVTVKDNHEEREIGRNVIHISAGKDHVLCLCTDKTVRAYGSNLYHQCDVSGWNHVKQIKAGGDCSVAITEDNKTLFTGKLENNTVSLPKEKSDASVESGSDNEMIRIINEFNAMYTENDCNGISPTVSNVFKCSICGYIHREPFPPEQCALCRAPKEKFIKKWAVASNIKLMEGSIPIMFSAPYSVRYKRNGETRQANAYIGSMVEFLCKRYHAHGITRIFNNDDDPNSSKDIGNYRKTLETYIQKHGILCLIDLYGCSDVHGGSIEICTNNGKNINPRFDVMDLMKVVLGGVGKICIDDKQSVGRNTICNYVHKRTNISCYRIELSAFLRKTPENLVEVIKKMGLLTELLCQYDNTQSSLLNGLT